jgi:hypothetical protein
VRDPAPFVTRWRSRTVAGGDSITLPVRRCFQCSAGKSKNVRSTSVSFSRVVTAFGDLGRTPSMLKRYHIIALDDLRAAAKGSAFQGGTPRSPPSEHGQKAESRADSGGRG